MHGGTFHSKKVRDSLKNVFFNGIGQFCIIEMQHYPYSTLLYYKILRILPLQFQLSKPNECYIRQPRRCVSASGPKSGKLLLDEHFTFAAGEDAGGLKSSANNSTKSVLETFNNAPQPSPGIPP